MIEEILGAGVSEVASILGVCEQSRKHPQHQNHQPDGFFRWLFYTVIISFSLANTTSSTFLVKLSSNF